MPSTLAVNPKEGTVALSGPLEKITPKKPPVKVLVDHGISDDMPTVGRKVAAISAAHRKKFGIPPSPGLVFDVLRSNVAEDEIAPLFDSVARNRRDARVRQLARTPGIAGEGFDPDVDALADMSDAIRAGRYSDWLDDESNQDW